MVRADDQWRKGGCSSFLNFWYAPLTHGGVMVVFSKMQPIVWSFGLCDCHFDINDAYGCVCLVSLTCSPSSRFSHEGAFRPCKCAWFAFWMGCGCYCALGDDEVGDASRLSWCPRWCAPPIVVLLMVHQSRLSDDPPLCPESPSQKPGLPLQMAAPQNPFTTRISSLQIAASNLF